MNTIFRERYTLIFLTFYSLLRSYWNWVSFNIDAIHYVHRARNNFLRWCHKQTYNYKVILNPFQLSIKLLCIYGNVIHITEQQYFWYVKHDSWKETDCIRCTDSLDISFVIHFVRVYVVDIVFVGRMLILNEQFSTLLVKFAVDIMVGFWCIQVVAVVETHLPIFCEPIPLI